LRVTTLMSLAAAAAAAADISRFSALLLLRYAMPRHYATMLISLYAAMASPLPLYGY